MRFMIKALSGEAERESDGTIVRFTGNTEPFSRSEEMAVKQVGVENDKSPKLLFATGLDEDKVENFGWFTREQKQEQVKLIQELKPILSQYFGGDDVLDSRNKYFWMNPERRRINIVNETLNRVFDTKNPEHAMFYFNVTGGAFLETIAPTKEMAEVKTIPHFLILETDVEDSIADDYGTKADAYSNLRILDKEEGGDALLYLSWVLQSKSKGFGAYTRSSPKSELLKYHGEFIEGKLTKTKRNCPKDFVTESEKWKQGGLVREAIQVEAYLRAAEFYSYLNVNREKKYELPSGAVLGVTIEEATDNIRKPKNTKDLTALRNFIEAKWKD